MLLQHTWKYIHPLVYLGTSLCKRLLMTPQSLPFVYQTVNNILQIHSILWLLFIDLQQWFYACMAPLLWPSFNNIHDKMGDMINWYQWCLLKKHHHSEWDHDEITKNEITILGKFIVVSRTLKDSKLLPFGRLEQCFTSSAVTFDPLINGPDKQIYDKYL